MSRKLSIKLLIALCAFGLVAATSEGGAFASPANVGSASLLPNNGACDKSKSTVELGLITVLASPVLSLGDQADAAQASVKAFNRRGGVGKHCMSLTVCDDGADPNKAADCARKFADSKIVATINDTTAFGPKGVIDILAAAGIPRVDISPGTDDLRSPITYAIGAGGVGTTFMMVPPLTRSGVKKIYMIGVDTPQIDLIPPVLKPMIASYGGEFVGSSKVPAGTTDFQQFILAAEDAGADGVILPLGENEAIQVLRAAQQVGTKLKFSASLGTFGKADVASYGKFAKQLVFNAELPPITGDQKRWPILKTAIADLAASGKKELQRDQIKSSPFRSWVAVYHFVTIMEKFGNPDNLTRQSVTAAMNAATNVDTFGLIPAWTPNQEGGVLGFTRISQPWYYQVSWNGKKFVVAKDKINVINELDGNHNYPQPAS